MTQKILKAKKRKVAPKKAATKVERKIVLVGTYREGQLAWIKKNRLYNFPVREGDKFGAALGKVSELWLYAGTNAKRHCYEAKFVRQMTREEWLKENPTYGKKVKGRGQEEKVKVKGEGEQRNDNPLNSSGTNAAYYVFEVRPLEYGTRFDAPEVITRAADFGGRSAKIKKAIEQYMKDGKFASLAAYLPTELSQVPKSQLRVCDPLMQMDFFSIRVAQHSDASSLPRVSARAKFRFIDLFAGIGGIRLGFERAGNQCVFTSEWDHDAQVTYSANWPGEPIFGDITKVDPNAIPDFDILCGGFPCQPFSSIGKRQGFNHPTQGTLFFNVRNIIAAKKPDAFFLENVPGLETHDGGRTISIVLNTLKDELGYDTSYAVLDAADYGVPQHRRRAFFVGYKKTLNAVFRFPEPTNAGVYADIQQYLESDAAIAEKSLTDPKYKSRFAISKHLQDVYIWKKDDGHPQIVGSDQDEDPHVNLRHGPVKTLCASYHKIQRITGTFVKGGPTGLRMLTELECKRIQGFPDSFKIPVCKTSMYHQFGNSVAVPVIEAIARRMTDTLTECREKRSNIDAGEAVSNTELYQGGCSI